MVNEKNERITDLSYLEQLSNGDKGFVKEMIEVFIVQTPEGLDNLERHLSNKDWKMVRAVAHKMKPSFTFVGVKELTGVMGLIEEYAESQTHLELIPDLLVKVKSSCAKAMIELEAAKNFF